MKSTTIRMMGTTAPMAIQMSLPLCRGGASLSGLVSGSTPGRAADGAGAALAEGSVILTGGGLAGAADFAGGAGAAGFGSAGAGSGTAAFSTFTAGAGAGAGGGAATSGAAAAG